jgi:hypothetical protein
MSKITIQYSPRKWAIDNFHNDTHRYKVLVLARRSGKTVASINHLIRESILNKGNYAYIAPFQKQAKMVAWDMLKKYTKDIPDIVINESSLQATLPNGSKISCLGSDNADALRGISLQGVILDEYAQHKSSVWGEIIRPMLADTQGFAIFLFTPKGRNQAYDMYKKALNDPEWHTIAMNVYEVGELAESEIASLKRDMTTDEFNQEMMISFDSAVQGAVYAEEFEKMKAGKRITNVKYDSALPVHTAWDLGVSDSTAILWFQKIGTEFHIIDCYENNGKGLDFYIKLVNEKDYIYGTHFAPHDIKARELTTGKTRLEIAQTLGIDFEVLPAMATMDSINATRLRLRNTWIDTTCEKLIDYLGLYHFEWNDSRGSFSDKPKHDYTSHMMDALKYFGVCDPRNTVTKATITFAPQFYNSESNDNFDIRF